MPILKLEYFKILSEDICVYMRTFLKLTLCNYMYADLNLILNNNSPSVTRLWMFCIPILLVLFISLARIFPFYTLQAGSSTKKSLERQPFSRIATRSAVGLLLSDHT